MTTETTEKKEAKQHEEPKYIKLKRYSPGELAKIYEVDRRTLHRWINAFKEEIGKREGRFYTIPQVRIIFNNLSIPGIVLVE